MSGTWLRQSLLAAMVCASVGVQAQFDSTPVPLGVDVQAEPVRNEDDYREVAARHLYAQYAGRIYKGRLPPNLYGIAVVETVIDRFGRIVNLRLKRAPAAAEVGPWVLQMVRQAAPFPPPGRLGRVTYQDVWLVHEDGNFQLHTLTEGQD